eukprot:m51a1_g3715 hypothetical protein (148) ;mRNA; r:454951-455520
MVDWITLLREAVATTQASRPGPARGLLGSGRTQALALSLLCGLGVLGLAGLVMLCRRLWKRSTVTSKAALPRTSTFPEMRCRDTAKSTEVLGFCVVCEEGPRTEVFVPCNHRVVCAACQASYFDTPGSKCPFCRARIDSVLSIFCCS